MYFIFKRDKIIIKGKSSIEIDQQSKAAINPSLGTKTSKFSLLSENHTHLSILPGGE